MSKINDYLWIIPFLGGIIMLGAIFAPIGTYSIIFLFTSDLWMWGLWLNNPGFIGYIPYGSPPLGMSFYPELIGLISGIIISIILLCCSILIIVYANEIRKKNRFKKEFKNILLSISIFVIILEISWMVLMDFSFSRYLEQNPSEAGVFTYMLAYQSGIGSGFWFAFKPGFGVIGIFMGASVVIVGAGIYRDILYRDRELGFEKATKPEIRVKEKKPMAKGFKFEFEESNFCPSCGAKIKEKSASFCSHCGAKRE